MALRHAILGLLSERERSGYDIGREFDVETSLVWPAPRNEVYRELRKLEAAGLIHQSGSGARNRKTWIATEAGVAELRRWMVEDVRYDLSYGPMLRAVFLDQLPPEQRRTVLERDRAFYEAELGALSGPTRQPRRAAAHRMVTAFYTAMLAWVDEELSEGAPPPIPRRGAPGPP